MAISSSFLTLDIGAYSLKAALFRPHGSGLMIDAFTTVPMVANEDGHSTAVTRALREALQNLGLKGLPVVYSVSGQSVFTRFVKLPPVAPDQVEQIVKFEAQQNVPFPIDEVVWDYQLMQAAGEAETEAVIVAIKSDILDRIDDAVLAAGCQPKRVDVAPMALCNAALFNYSDEQGCLLLVDIGAKSSQLLFIERGKIFIRGVPIAGNQVTQAIAQDLQESQTAAEMIKQDKGFVGLGGAYEDPPDPVAARVSKVVRGVLTKLHSEIVRSIGYYRTQQGGSAPVRVLLAGGASVMPYMDIFFGEKLGLPVEYFNPLRNVAVSPRANRDALSRSAHVLGEAVGLALREVAECPLEVDLIPPTTKARKIASDRLMVNVGAIAAAVALFGGLWFTDFRKSEILSSALIQAEEERDRLAAEVKKLNAEQGSLQSNRLKAESLLALAEQRHIWQNLLGELNRMTPTGVWITSMIPGSNGAPLPLMVKPGAPPQPGAKVKASVIAATELLIEGFYEAYDKEALQSADQNQVVGEQAIKKFLSSFTQSPYFSMTSADTENPKLVAVDVAQGQEKNLALTFAIKAKLKEPIVLAP